MIQTTIYNITNIPWEMINPDCTNTVLYLVRHENTVFYVGQSYNPFDRLLCHLGQDWRNDPSPLGQLIWNNRPGSEQWAVELYTLEDARCFVEQDYKDLAPLHYTLDMAEIAMIGVFRPCLNTTHNSRGLPLPEKYTHVRPNASSSQYIGI